MLQLRVLHLESNGELRVTESWLRKLLRIDLETILGKYGSQGVELLAAATPKRTGLTAASWKYTTKISRNSDGGVRSASIEFSNTNLSTSKDKIPIIILIEYGHGTRNGGYVPPHPFITETLRPLFDELAEKLWKEVRDA